MAEVRGDSPSLTLLSAHNFYSPAATLVPDMKSFFAKQQNFAGCLRGVWSAVSQLIKPFYLHHPSFHSCDVGALQITGAAFTSQLLLMLSA